MLPTSRFTTVTAGCQVPIVSICIDLNSQPRAQIHPHIVRDYAVAMRSQAAESAWRFPAVVLFYDGRTYWIADGLHRVLAAEKAGIQTVLAEVHAGQQRDALLYSLSANNAHGLPRTNADKRKVVSLLLADTEWRVWSDREIARHCQVSHQFVKNMRRRTSVNGLQTRQRKARRGGTVYKMNTEAIGKALPASAKAALDGNLQMTNALLCSSCPFWSLFPEGVHGPP